MKRSLFLGAAVLTALVCLASQAEAAKAKKNTTARSAAVPADGAEVPPKAAAPACLGAIVVDAATGRTLYEENADVAARPASVLKLMDLLILLERIDAGTLKLTDAVTITAEASRIGGSQVYLKEKEVFSIDELLYAMVVPSANDAATALAIHVAGSKDAFLELMNQRAKALGMNATVFHSVHGLPPGPGQEPDVTTPRDLARLCLALLKHKDTLRYTSVHERPFRPDAKEPFIMRTHNHLMAEFEGCDGLKTGYYKEAGFSIAATAQRQGRRVIAIVMGSQTRVVRDQKAQELLAKGFLALAEVSPLPPVPAAPVPAVPAGAPPAPPPHGRP